MRAEVKYVNALILHAKGDTFGKSDEGAAIVAKRLTSDDRPFLSIS